MRFGSRLQPGEGVVVEVHADCPSLEAVDLRYRGGLRSPPAGPGAVAPQRVSQRPASSPLSSG